MAPEQQSVVAARMDGLVREMDRRFDNVEKTLVRIEANIGDDYVTRKEFMPVMWIVYGLVAIIATGVLGAVMTVVLRSGSLAP